MTWEDSVIIDFHNGGAHKTKTKFTQNEASIDDLEYSCATSTDNVSLLMYFPIKMSSVFC